MEAVRLVLSWCEIGKGFPAVSGTQWPFSEEGNHSRNGLNWGFELCPFIASKGGFPESLPPSPHRHIRLSELAWTPEPSMPLQLCPGCTQQ
jgi:hypothetical protein